MTSMIKLDTPDRIEGCVTGFFTRDMNRHTFIKVAFTAEAMCFENRWVIFLNPKFIEQHCELRMTTRNEYIGIHRVAANRISQMTYDLCK